MNRYNLVAIAFVLSIFVTTLSVVAKPKPSIQMGMSRAEMIKALPKYKKEFSVESTNAIQNVMIKGFEFHGMFGDASFAFTKGKLILFTWEHKALTSVMLDDELKSYSKVLLGLHDDYGSDARSEQSEEDPRVKLCYWHLPTASGHTSLRFGVVKFQIADNDWLDSTRPKK
jgi:hypothetical protein